MPIGEILAAINAIKVGVEIWDKLKNKLPDSSDKAELIEKIEEAQRAVKMAETNVAKELGYHLCQCTWPPQIMLSIGYASEGSHECFQCSSCRKIWPNPDRPRRVLSSGL